MCFLVEKQWHTERSFEGLTFFLITEVLKLHNHIAIGRNLFNYEPPYRILWFNNRFERSYQFTVYRN